VVPRRLCRSRSVEQDNPHLPRRRRLPGRQPGRQEPAFRHSRARHGRNRQRLALSKLRPFGASSSSSATTPDPRSDWPRSWNCLPLFVFTHDAMGDGEDGPTHQPGRTPRIPPRHTGTNRAASRRMPMSSRGYRYIVQRATSRPYSLLSRQPLPTLDRTKYAPASGVAKAPTSSPTPPAEIRKRSSCLGQ